MALEESVAAVSLQVKFAAKLKVRRFTFRALVQTPNSVCEEGKTPV